MAPANRFHRGSEAFFIKAKMKILVFIEEFGFVSSFFAVFANGFVLALSIAQGVPFEVLRAALMILLDDVEQWVCFVIFTISRIAPFQNGKRGDIGSPRLLIQFGAIIIKMEDRSRRASPPRRHDERRRRLG